MIIAGSVYTVETNPGAYDANYYGLLLTALLPTLIYVFGVTSRRRTLICGSLLLGITALGWVGVLQDDAMRGVGAVLAFPITLAVSIAYAAADRARPRNQ